MTTRAVRHYLRVASAGFATLASATLGVLLLTSSPRELWLELFGVVFLSVAVVLLFLIVELVRAWIALERARRLSCAAFHQGAPPPSVPCHDCGAPVCPVCAWGAGTTDRRWCDECRARP